MQRLVEQPSGDGEIFAGSLSLGNAHYHLSVYQHFSGSELEKVPANVEVEGHLRPKGVDVGELHRRRSELTLRLSDGRALDFSFIDEDGRLHSTGRQLYQP
jgi:hypothetical protein